MAAGFGAALLAGAAGRRGMRGALAAPLLAGGCAGCPLSQVGTVASWAAAAEFWAAEGCATGDGGVAAEGLAAGGGEAAGVAAGGGVLAAGVCGDFLASREGAGFSSSRSRRFFPPIRRGREARGRETIRMGMSREFFRVSVGRVQRSVFRLHAVPDAWLPRRMAGAWSGLGRLWRGHAAGCVRQSSAQGVRGPQGAAWHACGGRLEEGLRRAEAQGRGRR